MRHARGYRRLNRTHEHRKALFSNMAGSLIEHEQIKTTLPKAKELRPIIEKMITLAKRGDLHARRQVASKLKQDRYVVKLFEVLGPRYKNRHGGYVRILKAGFRYGDMAPMAIIEFVDRDESAKGAMDKARAKMGRSSGEAVMVSDDLPPTPKPPRPKKG
ncbi:50S ribosomal protein L17 [Tritonibacter mobilis]|uniref:50S ribosomal protein L17 n=1 Tax=Tritonibacter mobilis TaxID=379347 RepID=UPI0039A65D25